MTEQDGLPALAVPTVHLNGTSAEELMNQLRSAALAVQNAMNVLALAAPHGRDYYPQNSNAINDAMEQHRSRMRRLSEVHTELFELHEAVYRQRRTP